jgi:hypothetical protein
MTYLEIALASRTLGAGRMLSLRLCARVLGDVSELGTPHT